MNREKLQENFCKSLEKLGFNKANSLDRRIATYIKANGGILYMENYSTEVNVDYYGFTIAYRPSVDVRYKKIFSWSEWGANDATEAFRCLFNFFGLKMKTDGTHVRAKSRIQINQ